MNGIKNKLFMQIQNAMHIINKNIESISEDIMKNNLETFQINKIVSTLILENNKHIFQLNQRIVLMQETMLKVYKDIFENNKCICYPKNTQKRVRNINKNIKSRNESKQRKSEEEREITYETNTKQKVFQTNISSSSLLDFIQDKREGNMHIESDDQNMTSIIKNTFEGYGCQVTCYNIQKNIIILKIYVNKQIKTDKFKELLKKGKQLGLKVFLTKTGAIGSILDKMKRSI